MALNADQQAMVDQSVAIDNARTANQLLVHSKNVKLEAIRVAQAALTANANSKPIGEREVTAAAITTYAGTLEAYMSA